MHPEASEYRDAAANRFKAAEAPRWTTTNRRPSAAARDRRSCYSMDRARAVRPAAAAWTCRPTCASPRRGEPAVDLDDDRRPLYAGHAEPYQMGVRRWRSVQRLAARALLRFLLEDLVGGGTTIVNEGDTYAAATAATASVVAAAATSVVVVVVTSVVAVTSVVVTSVRVLARCRRVIEDGGDDDRPVGGDDAVPCTVEDQQRGAGDLGGERLTVLDREHRIRRPVEHQRGCPDRRRRSA